MVDDNAMNRRDMLKLLSIASGNAVAFSRGAAGELLAASPSLANETRTPTPKEHVDEKDGVAPVFTWLTLGQVKPAAWIKEQMVRDLNQGFAGRLDELCEQASSDIFVTHRVSGRASDKKEGWNGATQWWNGETEGNWRAGHIMLAFLTENKTAMLKAEAYVRHILSSQDEDGYLGIYAPELRFSEPGELWTQACLLRGLLDYAELTGDQKVRDAVVRATDLIISVYGSGKTALESGVGGSGESHDLMISDVAERLFDLTGDVKYRDFTLSLYQQLSLTAIGADTSLPSLLNLNSGWADHGVNTYETIRVPLWLWMATGNEDLGRASRNALDKLDRYIEPSGSAVSQESIAQLEPDPTFTQYEYCSTKEIQFTLESALQKTGVASLGDKIERIWLNAAQGSRLPDGTAITYLTSDNRLHCDGMAPGGIDHDTRDKFSPTHADAAVCCNPNAANVAALYVRGMWMRHAGGGLAALLYGPCKVSTTVRDVRVEIEERTNYPFDDIVEIVIQPEHETEFPLFLRDPEWSRGTTVTCDGAAIGHQGGYWTVTKKWRSADTIRINFVRSIQERRAVNGEVALQYGPLVFAQSIEAHKVVIKTYPIQGFEDAYFLPVPNKFETLSLPAALRWRSFGFSPALAAQEPGNQLTNRTNALHPFDTPVLVLRGNMIRHSDGAEVAVTLVPLGNAPTLRRVTFPISP